MSSRVPPKLDALGACSIVTRYRLTLVREPEVTYQPTLGADPPGCSHPYAAAAFLWPKVAEEPGEVLGVLLLDVRQRAIGYGVLYRGTLNRAAVEPRGILQAALLAGAAGMVVFHNHPSGDPSPSAEDLAFTRRLAEAGEIVGVRLVDHIVFGAPGQWVSLAERGGW